MVEGRLLACMSEHQLAGNVWSGAGNPIVFTKIILTGDKSHATAQTVHSGAVPFAGLVQNPIHTSGTKFDTLPPLGGAIIKKILYIAHLYTLHPRVPWMELKVLCIGHAHFHLYFYLYLSSPRKIMIHWNHTFLLDHASGLHGTWHVQT